MEKLTEIVSSIGGVIGHFVATVQKSALDTLKMVATRFLPFLVLIAMLTGFINGSGLGNYIAKLLVPLASSLPGLVILSVICTIPIVSPVLAPGAVIAAIIGALIGEQIGTGALPPSWALPALWAIDAQVGCDSIPLQLGLLAAEEETMINGVPAYLISRWITGPIGVLVAFALSIGMY